MLIHQIKREMLGGFYPALTYALHQGNPEEVVKWGGNCCRQITILGCQVLTALHPEVEWQAWEGSFDDVIRDRLYLYEHAWIYGVRKDGPGIYINIDRAQASPVIIETTENGHCPTWPGYERTREISRKQIDWRAHLLEVEYYTSKPGWLLVAEVFAFMKEEGHAAA